MPQYEPLIITPPVKELISIEEARIHSHIEADDPNIEALDLFIPAARRWLERRTGRTFHETEYEYSMDGWPACHYIQLPRATPLISITNLKYVDSDEVVNTISSSIYIADTRSLPGRLVLKFNESWPSTTLSPASPVRLTYKAGLTTSPTVEAEEDDKLAALMLIAGMWENRENEVVSEGSLNRIALQYGVETFIANRMARYEF